MRDHMESDDYTIDISSVEVGSISTVSISDYVSDTIDTVDIESITNSDWVFTTSRDENRKMLRDSGKIPVDIWAKIYNNGIIDD